MQTYVPDHAATLDSVKDGVKDGVTGKG